MSDRRLPYIFTPAALTLLACLLFGVPSESIEPVVEEVKATREQVAANEVTQAEIIEAATTDLTFAPVEAQPGQGIAPLPRDWLGGIWQFDTYVWPADDNDDPGFDDDVYFEDCQVPCIATYEVVADPELDYATWTPTARFCAPTIADLRAALEHLEISFLYASGEYDWRYQNHIDIPDHLIMDDVKELRGQVCFFRSTGTNDIQLARFYYFEVRYDWDAVHTNATGVTQSPGTYLERWLFSLGDVDPGLSLLDWPVDQTRDIPVGEWVTDTPTSGFDVHEWRFQGQADEFVTIAVDATYPVYAEFVVIDSNGALLADSSGDTLHLYELTYFLEHTGTYAVRVLTTPTGDYEIALDPDEISPSQALRNDQPTAAPPPTATALPPATDIVVVTDHGEVTIPKSVVESFIDKAGLSITDIEASYLRFLQSPVAYSPAVSGSFEEWLFWAEHTDDTHTNFTPSL